MANMQIEFKIIKLQKISFNTVLLNSLDTVKDGKQIFHGREKELFLC